MEYRPLNFMNFEFRLLTIAPLLESNDEDADSTIVSCSLSHSTLVRPPSYQALSYCWGDASITRPVVVNDHLMHVTTNLEAALRELRRQGITTIWIDALCINQNDLMERSLQVTRMGLIYSSAEAVIVWLGEESSNSRIAFRQLRMQAPEYAFSSTAWRSTSSQNNSSTLNEELEACEINPLRSLFERPYWKRVWIIQEISKARQLNVHCGGDVISWAELTKGFKESKDTDNQTIIPPEALSLKNFRDDEQQVHSGNTRPPLSKIILMSKEFLATDGRDKVYALLGLSFDGSEIIPTPNYLESTTIESVMFQAIKGSMCTTPLYSYLCKAKSDDEILETAIVLGSSQRPSTLGIPDWTNLEYGFTYWILQDTIKAMDYDGGRLPFDSRQCILPMDPGNANWPHRLSYSGLQASVFMLGTFQDLTPSLNFSTSNQNIRRFNQTPQHSLQLGEKILEKHPLMVICACLKILMIEKNEWHNFNLHGYSGKKRWPPERQAHTLTYLCRKYNWAFTKNPKSDSEFFGNWVFENQNFPYDGIALRDWVETYAQTKQYKKGRRWGEEGLFKKITKKKPLPSVEEDAEKMLNSFKRSSQKNRRLQLANVYHNPGIKTYIVPSGTQTGDFLCMLYGSKERMSYESDQNSIVLRFDKEEKYHFIGIMEESNVDVSANLQKDAKDIIIY